MRGRRTATLAAAAAVIVVTAGPAQADPLTDFEMPFPCAQSWAGSTRDSHSPSPYAIDWNRTDDIYDPVVSSAPGIVTTADTVDDSGYGRWVVIDHGNSEKSLYAHMATVIVTVGQRVDQGTMIGTVGSTGNSSGPHLHYEQRRSSTVTAPFFTQVRYAFGTTAQSRNCADVPLAADWTGDRVADLTVFRRAWPASFQVQRPGTTPLSVPLGVTTDEPVIGDWDGNGTADAGVRTPPSREFRMKTAAGVAVLAYGNVGDRPVAGNWGGDAKWEIGVWRPSTATFHLRGATGVTTSVKLGDVNDLPVTGDWNGDGITDVGVYDQATATFTLRHVDASDIVWTASMRFGTPGDLPAVGDWDGNRRTDLGTWTPNSATFNRRMAPTATATARTSSVQFGTPRR